jgi:hypothetical protein
MFFKIDLRLFEGRGEILKFVRGTLICSACFYKSIGL